MATPLLVFSDDWGRHPSSCQHLTRQLLPGRRVDWVNTIGTRVPKLDLLTVRRGFGKLAGWLRPKPKAERQALPANLHVHAPIMWPYYTRGYDRRLNDRLLARTLNRLVAELPEPPVAVTTLPIVAGLVGRVPVKKWVYYCVDDFSQWPGLDGKTLGDLEAELVKTADVLVAVSRTLQDRLKGMGRDSELLTHGVDTEFWSAPADRPAAFADLERPLVVFWGVVDRRMDVEFLRRLAADLTQGTIIIAGPENEPDPALKALPRTRLLGPLEFADLPVLAAAAAVLVMPYADLPVTRAMQPLKLKEYLATGRPVVVRDLPANRDWADALDLVATPEAFSRLVRERVGGGIPEGQRAARGRLASESWQAKSSQFAVMIGL